MIKKKRNLQHFIINLTVLYFYDAIIILGFIAQLFISLMRYEFEEIKHKSTKFIKKSLKNLTLTIKFVKNGLRNYIFANFDKINSLIVTKMGTIP